ncbi:hypothetical protein FD41_GL000067 [Lentilactobacillus farraginis DSM 18382 = JCM 14108]|uniref:Uncharacterized protein n=1 Tax=Lentilactobacillus farraginis DSM 18382 = JCM 14108 TaxID=1423743 RepID=X0PI69_9LACO|nr:hypothetical protein FD41_GL000067 [Lentilactobacillus farraginis DSM 18382 = JCM 14108]GAF36787.1 hypothetical protein JCM14108_1771 [Lentilactobacillus farraginis DSM 18382 = JCM 14108]
MPAALTFLKKVDEYHRLQASLKVIPIADSAAFNHSFLIVVYTISLAHFQKQMAFKFLNWDTN